MARIEVLKTYKLFIDGKFPRSESGRVSAFNNAKGKLIAQVCKGSRKDFKAATVAARNAQPAWAARTPYNRSQILYRIAEMLESRASQFIEEMVVQGLTKKKAEKELQLSVDRLVHYAGWCDKYSAVFSSVNPVSSSHLNFSQPEPMGIVAVFAAEKLPLLGLVSMMAPIIAGGNTCMILASETYPMSALSFGEVLATSDLPAGVVNIISAERGELAIHAADHRDINALVLADATSAERKELETACARNLKRFFKWDLDWSKPESQNPYLILDLQEIKTTWHPLENTGVSGTKY